jgi:parallel beta-helix repeat protein
MLVALVVVLGVVAVPAAAVAEQPTLHVNGAAAHCSNNGPGTVTQPLCTISAGATKATAGTTVLVYTATYNEQVSPKSGAAGAPVTIKAAPGHTPVVTGKANGFYLSSKSWVTIEGFTITKTTSDAVYVSKSSNIHVVDNEIKFAGEPVSGRIAKGIRFSATTDSLARGNRIHHNTDFGIYMLDSSTRVELRENVIWNNAREYTRAASGIRVHGSSSNTIDSNTSYGNEDSGIEIGTGSTNHVVTNNVTYDNGDHGIDV